MIYPKGEAIHRNLSTEYTDLPGLLSTLKSNDFAGIVEVEGADKKGTFFVGYGRTLNALVEGKANSMAVVGEQAAADLLGLSTQPNTTLSVYRLTAKEVELAASTLKSEVLFRGLTTDFVRLDRFVKKLSDDRHNGYIEVFAKNDKPMGILFLKDGKLEDLSITSESGSPALLGQEAIPAFLESVMKQGAMFNAYRSVYSSLPEQEDAKAEEEPQVTSLKETTDEVEEKNVPKEVRILLCAQQADGSENGRNEFVLGLEGVFSSIEKVVDGFSEKGGFQRAFKKALLEKSDLYPFLDPFGNQFDYHDGKMLLDPDVRTEQFAVGVADCLRLALSYLKQEFPKNTVLPAGLKLTIESSFKSHQEVLKRSGLQSVVPADFR